MISTLEIRNFKSIRHLRLDCRRVNVFIGEPNTGKSNILEAVGVFSVPFTGNFRDFIRMENMADLFCDNRLEDTVRVEAKGDGFEGEFECTFQHEKGVVKGFIQVPGVVLFEETILPEGVVASLPKRRPVFPPRIRFQEDRLELEGLEGQSAVRFYRFAPNVQFQRIPSLFLLPPDGKNLPFLLISNKEVRRAVGDLLIPFGLRLVIDSRGEYLKVYKGLEGEEFAQFPWCAVSETLRRVAFYLAAIETNRGSVLIFEEPESHAFPYYTKFLAEQIALDSSNQYFLSTHNPYLLHPLLLKTPVDDLAIFLTYFQDHQTMVRPVMGRAELEKVLNLKHDDLFLNLDLFLER